VSLDLVTLFESLVLPLEQPSARSLSAAVIPGFDTHRLAIDASGSPCLLLRQPAAAPAAPTRLQNLMVSYAVPCIVGRNDGVQEQGVFTIIKCASADPSLYPHFLRVLSPLIMLLGASPSAAAVRRAIVGLVQLFQALTTPAKKSVQGLWAELLLIRYATDPAQVATAWHGTPGERVDFAAGKQRCEVKSSSTHARTHHFSLAQLTPPPPARLIVASVFVESIGGGMSLGNLFDETRALLASDPAVLARFDGVFYSTLGSGWAEALDERFDLELARSSLQFFDAMEIPRAGDIPPTVLDVRFTSDLSALSPLPVVELSAAGGLLAAAIPSQ
jgi:Putative  PD-(D/E)XK family member, (DUF4420)